MKKTIIKFTEPVTAIKCEVYYKEIPIVNEEALVEIRKADNERNCYFVNYHGQQLKFPWYDNMFEKKIN